MNIEQERMKYEAALLMLRGQITELSPDNQKQVFDAITSIRDIVFKNGSLGIFALAFLLYEYKAKGEMPI